MGRPKKPASERAKRIDVTLPPATLTALDRLVMRAESTRSAVLTGLIEREAKGREQLDNYLVAVMYARTAKTALPRDEWTRRAKGYFAAMMPDERNHAATLARAAGYEPIEDDPRLAPQKETE